MVEKAREQGTFLNMFMEAKGRMDEFKKCNHLYHETQNKILTSLWTLLHTYITTLKQAVHEDGLWRDVLMN